MNPSDRLFPAGLLPRFVSLASLLVASLANVPASAQTASASPSGQVLVAVDVDKSLRSVAVPIRAHLTGAGGKEYVLSLIPGAEPRNPAWRVLEEDASGPYLIGLERRAGARLRAGERFPVLFDDGRHIVVRDAPGREDELAAMGFALDRLTEAPLDLSTTREPVIETTPPYDQRVQSIVNAVSGAELDSILSGLAGDTAVTVSGAAYTITTRNTRSGVPIQKATQYMFEQLSALGLAVSYHDWTYNGLTNRNVIAEKAGTVRASEIVLITAHLDDMPSSGAAPGADDNGSGSAAVLRIARALNSYTFERTLRFVLFTGEEQGLYGSRRYADTVAAAQDDIVGVLNMDMIAWDSSGGPTLQIHTRTTSNPGYDADKAIFDLFSTVVSQYGLSNSLQPLLAADGETASDHSSFWTKGYPAVLAIEDDYSDFNPYYHTANDKRQNTNLTYFTNFTKAAAGTAALLAVLEAAPCGQPIVPVRFDLDRDATSTTTGNLNGILEPGERALLNPFWTLPASCSSRLVTGQITLGGPLGGSYSVFSDAASYGYMTPGQAESPLGNSGAAYVVSVGTGSRPATHWDAYALETLSTGVQKSWSLHVGGSFLDVPSNNWAYPFVERLLHNGITTGISSIEYLPLGTVDRWQMAIFLARALAGGEASVPVSGTAKGLPYNCQAGGNSLFTDVSPADIYCKHVHYIYDRSITLGCDPGAMAYCPMTPVSRWQMAIFIARAVAGGDALVPVSSPAYSCEPASPRLHFGDVVVPDPYCRHVHYLWERGTVTGCSTDPALFCPQPSTNRAEMAKFLSLGFGLGL